MKPQMRGHAEWSGADRLPPRHHFKLNANATSKESNSNNCAENPVARTPCNPDTAPALSKCLSKR
jgi:hypothetical protein